MKREQNNILLNQALEEIFLAALNIPNLAFLSSGLKRVQNNDGNCKNSLKYLNFKKDNRHYVHI